MTHINTPDGLFILGKDLYVAEQNGDRVLKFDLTEPPVPPFSIGYAGVPWAQDDYLSHPAEACLANVVASVERPGRRWESWTRRWPSGHVGGGRGPATKLPALQKFPNSFSNLGVLAVMWRCAIARGSHVNCEM